MPNNRKNTIAPRIIDLIQLNPRFLRSVDVTQDLEDPTSSQSYIVTPFVDQCLKRITEGFQEGSTQRAWRITGDYGAGKSSFALALARIAAANKNELPIKIQEYVDEALRLEPLIISGDNEPIGVSIFRGLEKTLSRYEEHQWKVLSQIRTDLEINNIPSGQDVIKVLKEALKFLKKNKIASGLFLVFDELGKNLDYAVHHPVGDDIYVLQRVAEFATRSGKSPVIIVSLLHQGISAYAASLAKTARSEWEKISGRFEEIVFSQPLEQITSLVAASLQTDTKLLAERGRGEAVSSMQIVIENHWFGAVAGENSLTELAPKLYPLHPTVLPVLVRLFRRYGQNERSLFSFLSSSEPGGLLSQSTKIADQNGFYRIHNLYDYVRSNLSLAFFSTGSSINWGVIDSVIQAYPTNNEIELNVLKTIGMLNLLDSSDLAATKEIVLAAVAGQNSSMAKEVENILKDLAEKSVVFERGIIKGFSLWPHTSINLDEEFRKASKIINYPERIAETICNFIDKRSLVARKHYIETGTLRHFDVFFFPADELPTLVKEPPTAAGDNADGLVAIIITEKREEYIQVLNLLNKQQLPTHIVVGLPDPVHGVAPDLHELMCWRWIKTHTKGLSGDRFALEEVVRQVAAAKERLNKGLDSFVNLRSKAGGRNIAWFHEGEEIDLEPGRSLLEKLSKICDQLYCSAPILHNELINRRGLSSAASRARSQLIERLAVAPQDPYLGMDPTHTPPEMAIYLSVFQTGRVHVPEGNTLDGHQAWEMRMPPEEKDPCRLRPTLMKIEEILQNAGDQQVAIVDLFSPLKAAPYGARDGVIPLLLAAYLSINWHHTAVYEEGTYLQKVGAEEFARMLKEPEYFEFQHCVVRGIRADIFSKLATTLGVSTGKKTEPELLDIVRPLCLFIAQVKDYSRRTKNLSQKAVSVRKELLAAREPSTLLFRSLPQAVGIEPFENNDANRSEDIELFVQELQLCVQELREAYPALLKRIADSILRAFDSGEDRNLSAFRQKIGPQAKLLGAHIVETALKTFVLRIGDDSLDNPQWLESLASNLTRKPPERWNDQDETEFYHQLQQLVSRYKSVEAIYFEGATSANDLACKIALTAPDGNEIGQVIKWTDAEQQKVNDLEAEIWGFLKSNEKLGMVAAIHAIQKYLKHQSD